LPPGWKTQKRQAQTCQSPPARLIMFAEFLSV
jgi:hypothetical protein